jgi:hypothetical protein
VTDKATGKGVRAGLRFAPLPDNKFFGRPGYDSYRHEVLMHPSDADGRFRLVVIPGPGVLMAQVHGEQPEGVNPYKVAEFDAADRARVNLRVNGDDRVFATAGNKSEFMSLHHAVKVLDPAADAGTATCDLAVDPGKKITVEVRDADGKPLEGVLASGVTATWPVTFPAKGARVTVHALDPAKPRRLVFYHAGRKLAGTLTVRGDEMATPAVKLGPTGALTGRLLDPDGEPLAGVEVAPSFAGDAASELYRQLAKGQDPVRTDKGGRFRLEGVVPELPFGLSLRHGGQYLVGEPRLGQHKVKPGATLDLGDRKVKPGG